MKVGKFEIDIIYEAQCNMCHNFRSDLGFYGTIYKKPTAKQLKAEGWRYIEGVGQVCSKCYERIKNDL